LNEIVGCFVLCGHLLLDGRRMLRLLG
jgi:hypothetical protein